MWLSGAHIGLCEGVASLESKTKINNVVCDQTYEYAAISCRTGETNSIYMGPDKHRLSGHLGVVTTSFFGGGGGVRRVSQAYTKSSLSRCKTTMSGREVQSLGRVTGM